MQKYADIIMYPTNDPEIRFEKVMKLVEEICSHYPKQFLVFENGLFIVSSDNDLYIGPHIGGSLVKHPNVSITNEDKYIQRWMSEYLDTRIIKYIFKRVNFVLDSVQRELFLHRYMKYLVKIPMTRDELISKHSLSRKKYDSQMREIKEILYEVLDLDVVDDYGRWLSLSFVQYLREIRTGMKNGYIGLHPEWESF